MDLAGAAQKGPYLAGATVAAFELDDVLTQTGRSFTATVTADDGSWALPGVQLGGDVVLLEADGFYLDETTGEKTVARLKLRTYAPLSAGTVKVTLLGHLAAARAEQLVAEGASPADAVTRSAPEVLAALDLPQPAGALGHTTDLTEDSAAGATLLLLSSLMQQGRNTAELTEYLARLGGDIADGTVDDASLMAVLEDGMYALDPAEIRNNLIDHYASLGSAVSPADISDVLNDWIALHDPDGDCVGSVREGLDGSSPTVHDVDSACPGDVPDPVEEPCEDGSLPSTHPDGECPVVEEPCEDGSLPSTHPDGECPVVEEPCEDGSLPSTHPDGECPAVEEPCDDGSLPSAHPDGVCPAVDPSYAGGWPRRDHEAKAALATSNADSGEAHIPHISLTDQFGEEVDLYDLSGDVPIITVRVALWSDVDANLGNTAAAVAGGGECNTDVDTGGYPQPSCEMGEALAAGSIRIVVLVIENRDLLPPTQAELDRTWEEWGRHPRVLVVADPNQEAIGPQSVTPYWSLWDSELREVISEFESFLHLLEHL